jgi:hypothetical protein
VKEGPTPERLAGDLRDTGALEDMIGGASR